MAYDEFLADRVRSVFNSLKTVVVEKRMMGGLVFMVDDKMCIGLDKDKNTNTDRMMARINPKDYEASLEEQGVRKMDFTGKPMNGFVYISAESLDTDDQLEYWISKALEFNKYAKRSKK
jgi:hypothetical protein